MRRRAQPEESGVRHDRWLVSYADLVTLLFAFFVVMYSFSSVNDGKYRIVSASILTAFRNKPPEAVVTAPIQAPALSAPKTHKPPGVTRQKQRDTMRKLAGSITQVIAPLIEDGRVRVLETSRGVSIEINDGVLFAPGQALLQSSSSKAMQAIAQVLAAEEFPITIEGHTDDTPISTAQFPSNWELSALRATTVLRLFVGAGVLPTRLTAIGYADTRPVDANAQPEGRLRNRRVTILVDSAVPEKAATLDLKVTPAPPMQDKH
ncbi:MAG: flagellar motor protein MotD [Pseudomonadota bacterium]